MCCSLSMWCLLLHLFLSLSPSLSHTHWVRQQQSKYNTYNILNWIVWTQRKYKTAVCIQQREYSRVQSTAVWYSRTRIHGGVYSRDRAMIWYYLLCTHSRAYMYTSGGRGTIISYHIQWVTKIRVDLYLRSLTMVDYRTSQNLICTLCIRGPCRAF